jgi:hypothetical protein
MADLRAPDQDEDTAMNAPTSALYRVVAKPWVGRSLVAAAVLVLVLFGVFGVFRYTSELSLRPDTRMFYVAGKMWMEGRNPYTYAEYMSSCVAMFGSDQYFVTEVASTGFAYMPTAFPFCALVALWQPMPAFYFMLALNLAAVGAAALYAFRLSAVGVPEGPLRDSLRYFVPALVIGSPFTTHIVFQGQTTMVVIAALVAGWYYTFVRPRPILAGVLFALCTMKPQVALFALAGLFLQRRWRAAIAAAITSLLFAAYPLSLAGRPVVFVRDWLAVAHAYTTLPTNVVGTPNIFGLQSLLVAAGIPAPSLALLALPLLAGVWWFRDRIEPDELLAILVGSACLLLYMHDYDLAALAPIHGCLWKRAGRDRRAMLGTAAFYALLFAPQRGVRVLGAAHALLHWREVVLLVAVVWLFVAAIRSGPRGKQATSLDDGGGVVQA